MELSSEVTVTDLPPYLASVSQIHEVRTGYFPADNTGVKHASGTLTSYGLCYSGTVVAKDANDNYHPCGMVELTGASLGGDAVVTVGAVNQAAFRVGDKVAVFEETTSVALTGVVGEADDDSLRTTQAHGLKAGDLATISDITGGTGSVAGTYKVSTVDEVRDFAITGANADDDIIFAVALPANLKVGDKLTLSGLTGGTGGTLSAGTVYVHSITAVNKIKVAATLGGAALTYTADISSGTATVALESDNWLKLEGFTFTTDITAATLTIQRGLPQYQNLTGDRYISAINTGTGAITLSGANITASAGSLLLKLNAYRPAGILDLNLNTLQPMIDGSTVKMGKTLPVRHAGEVRKSKIVGSSALVRRALSGAPWIDPVTNTWVEQYAGGFVFLNL